MTPLSGVLNMKITEFKLVRPMITHFIAFYNFNRVDISGSLGNRSLYHSLNVEVSDPNEYWFFSRNYLNENSPFYRIESIIYPKSFDDSFFKVSKSSDIKREQQMFSVFILGVSDIGAYRHYILILVKIWCTINHFFIIIDFNLFLRMLATWSREWWVLFLSWLLSSCRVVCQALFNYYVIDVFRNLSILVVIRGILPILRRCWCDVDALPRI